MPPTVSNTDAQAARRQSRANQNQVEHTGCSSRRVPHGMKRQFSYQAGQILNNKVHMLYSLSSVPLHGTHLQSVLCMVHIYSLTSVCLHGTHLQSDLCPSAWYTSTVCPLYGTHLQSGLCPSAWYTSTV